MPRHGRHELFEAIEVGVELGEERLAGVLDLVLGEPAAKRLGQVSSEAVQPVVEHLQEASEVVGAGLVQESHGLGGVGVARGLTSSLPV
jgi:hypothetical protein